MKKTDILQKIKTFIFTFLIIVPFVFQLNINSIKSVESFLGFEKYNVVLDPFLKKIFIIIGDFMMSFHGNSILIVALLITAFVIVRYFKMIKNKSLIKSAIVPSLLFSFFSVFGYSFMQTDSWNLIFNDYRTFLKGSFLFTGYFCLFIVLICCLFFFFKKLHSSEKKSVPETIWFTDNKKSFFVVLGLILIMWLPSLIANFPGITNYDFFDMLDSFYGNPTYSLKAVNLIDPSVTLNNNNPVLQTLWAVGCMKIGTLIGVPAIGLFIFCYSQVLMFAAVFSFVLYTLAKMGVHKYLRIALILFFGLLPINGNYAITTLKDVNFAFVFIIYIIFLVQMRKDPQGYFNDKKNLWMFAFVNLLCMLLRNNGVYILLPTSIVLIIVYKKYWKRILIPFLMPSLIFIVIISNMLYPALKIAPGSKREMYSVPFQQTARLIKEHGDEIPEEDRYIIDQILDYSTLAKRYEPELSDKVKSTYNKLSTPEQMNEYLGVWAKWLFKYPDVYIQATMNNCYGYFYPEAKSWIAYTEITPPGERYGLQSPEILTPIRKFINYMPDFVREIPILGLFESIGFYTWLMILSVSYLFYIKKKHWIVIYTPIFVLLFTCVLSPANTMTRYIYPMILCVPILMTLIPNIYQEGEEKNG